MITVVIFWLDSFSINVRTFSRFSFVSHKLPLQREAFWSRNLSLSENTAWLVYTHSALIKQFLCSVGIYIYCWCSKNEYFSPFCQRFLFICFVIQWKIVKRHAIYWRVHFTINCEESSTLMIEKKKTFWSWLGSTFILILYVYYLCASYMYKNHMFFWLEYSGKVETQRVVVPRVHIYFYA